MKKDNDDVELYNESMPIKDVYDNIDMLELPDWILENMDDARVYGKRKRNVIMRDGRKYSLDNRLNDLSGNEWLTFLKSVFSTSYPTRGKESYAYNIRKIHPSPKPPQLIRDIIRFFTKKGGLVFDCFTGVGGTMLGAALCGREAVGIELNPDFILAYQAAANELGLKVFPVLQGDCNKILDDDGLIHKMLSGREISLMLIDPPYGDMMRRKKTGADIEIYGTEGTPFTNDAADLGNMALDDFLDRLKEIVGKILKYIKDKGYIVVFIKDLQPSGKTINFLHVDVVTKINKLDGVFYKGMKIWFDAGAKLYPYGYPFSFVSNQMHQYILIFRKEG